MTELLLINDYKITANDHPISSIILTKEYWAAVGRLMEQWEWPDIQSAPANTPSVQTFINALTQQDLTHLENNWLKTIKLPTRIIHFILIIAVLCTSVKKRVHVCTQFHLILQYLHQLLHGGQVAWLKLWPYRHICKPTNNTTSVTQHGQEIFKKNLVSFIRKLYIILWLTSCLTIQCNFKGTRWHTLVFDHVAKEEHHHAGIYLE